MVTSISKSEEKLVFALQLLGDKTRFKIFKLLTQDQELCVSEIASQLNVSVSAVSQHFRQFEMLGIVGKERAGQKICYCLNNQDIFVNQLKTLIKE